MGFIGGLVGGDSGNSGDSGMNYKADAATLDRPVTSGDATNANAQAQSAFNQQQAFVNAMAANNGLQQQQNVLDQVNALNGVGKQGNVFAQQQQLANQLQDMANGGGPNPAQAMFNQNTGNNIAGQAALMAGQRGAGANAGLIARQAAMQGGNMMQQAAGQQATQQAQQQINAIGALQGQQGMLAGQANQFAGQQAGMTNNLVNQQTAGLNALNSGAQGIQSNMLGQINAQNNAANAGIASQNTANSSIAGKTADGQNKLLGGVMNAAGSAFAMAEGGMVPPKPMYANGTPDAPISMSSAPMPTSTDTISNGPKSRLGKAMGGFSSTYAPDAKNPDPLEQGASNFTKGLIGLGKGIFGGDSVDPNGMGSQYAGAGYGLDVPGVSAPQAGGYGLGVEGIAGAAAPTAAVELPPVAPEAAPGAMAGLMGMLGGQQAGVASGEGSKPPMMEAKGGKISGKGKEKVPALVSAGEVYLSPDKVAKVASKGAKGKEILDEGEKIKGKAKVKGDSYANDTISKTLEAGGIVLPRHVTQAKDPGKAAEAFVNAVLAKQNMKRGSK